MKRVFLRSPQLSDHIEIENSYAKSRLLHFPWTGPPSNLTSDLQQPERYFVCLKTSAAIVGTFNISNMIEGNFYSAYLGYEAFHPYQAQGYMREGLELLLEHAFGTLNLHRLEANIQPDNIASIRLVSRAGFIKEGFSRQYLRVDGKTWQDHERWAILNQSWQAPTK